MNRIHFLFLTLFAAAPALATNKIINCASTTLGQTYSNSVPSLVFSGVTYGNGTLVVNNPTTVRLCFNTVQTSSATPPTAGDGNEHCVAPGEALVLEKINSATQLAFVYSRADQANCTTGTFDVDLY